MANDEHLAILDRGVPAWNRWRDSSEEIPDLSGADLQGRNLRGANLSQANLKHANLSKAEMHGANLNDAHLQFSNLSKANLSAAVMMGAKLLSAYLPDATLERAYLLWAGLSLANLSRADLGHANLNWADLSQANLKHANLSSAGLSRANLELANLEGANLSGATLTEVNFSEACLSAANLSRASLLGAQLIRTDLSGAQLDGANVYGVAAWDVNLDRTSQSGLVITRPLEPEVSVDRLEMAQFIYLLLNNQSIRTAIDTITSKVVLILGRFTAERKAVLDALRDALRTQDLVPVVFDFTKPASKDVTGTVETLARMARFIVADLTDPSSIPHELATIVPFLRTTPVVLLRLAGTARYGMASDLEPYDRWVLPVREYPDPAALIARLHDFVILPAEARLKVLRPDVPQAAGQGEGAGS